MDDLERKSHIRNYKQKIALNERIFNCESCNISIDRDLNASINILEYNAPVKRKEYILMDNKTSTCIIDI